MSRIGKEPVKIPEGVEVSVNGKDIKVKGKLGELALSVAAPVSLSIADKQIDVTRSDDSNESRSLHGLSRSLISNMVTGVSKGFKKNLEINGVGYRAELKGSDLKLSLGFSHPVIFPLPKAVTAEVDGRKTKITLTSYDKQLLGVTAAKIRSFRPPEPYRGKGVKYAEEVIKRKEGKSAGK